MSNEYKEWLYDKVVDTLINANVVDKVTHIEPHWHRHSYIADGVKNGAPVKFEVWFSDWEAEWKFEHREI